NASDAAMNPTIVIDNNPASFTDPVTNITQVDPFSGAIYVAWTTRLAPPNGGNPPPPPTFNPNTIQVVGSFDGGTTFSTTVPLAGNHFLLSRLNAGQLTGVWDDFGSGSTANPKFDNVVSNSLSGGGGIIVDGTNGPPGDALTGTPNIPVTTPFNAFVNIND